MIFCVRRKCNKIFLVHRYFYPFKNKQTILQIFRIISLIKVFWKFFCVVKRLFGQHFGDLFQFFCNKGTFLKRKAAVQTNSVSFCRGVKSSLTSACLLRFTICATVSTFYLKVSWVLFYYAFCSYFTGWDGVRFESIFLVGLVG